MTNIAKTDIDIDVKDRDVLLEKLKHIPASIINKGEVKKHNTGVYFTDIPVHPFTNTANIDYKEADKEILKEKERILTTSKSLATSQSSSSLRWDRACEKLQDDKMDRKKLNYIIYHSSLTAADEWDDEKKKLVKRLDKWLLPQGYTYKIIVMPYKREKVVL